MTGRVLLHLMVRDFFIFHLFSRAQKIEKLKKNKFHNYTLCSVLQCYIVCYIHMFKFGIWDDIEYSHIRTVLVK